MSNGPEADADLGGEVKLGSALFTLVEPHKGHEVAYNRWYERDHFYAGCMMGPWYFAGRRWVATRDLKDMRTGKDPDVFGGAKLGSYLATYWVIAGRHQENTDWATRQVHWLHANGRMFPHRDHIHTLLYKFRWASGPEDGVPPELALDHPYQGLVASLVEADDPQSLAPAGTLTIGMRPIPLPEGAPVTQKGLDRLDQRQMLLTFLDHPPTADDVPDGPGVIWSSPFIPTIPGTDTYTDQL